MADNLSVTPGSGAALRTTEAGGVHTPHHHDADRTALIAAIGEVVTALGGQATQDGLDAIADVLAGTLAVSAATLPLPEGAATNTAVEAIATALGQTLAVSGPLTDAQLAARALATAAKQDALATAVGLLATQSTAAATLAKMIAAPATEAKQDALNAIAAPSLGAAVITPGTPVTAGKRVFIACTVAGNVRLKLSNASTLDVPVNVGASMIDDVAVIDVVAANTTATAVVSVL